MDKVKIAKVKNHSFATRKDAITYYRTPQKIEKN